MNRLLEDFHGPGLSALDVFCLWIGRAVVLSVALFFLGALFVFLYGRMSPTGRYFRAWFTRERIEIPDFIRCTCQTIVQPNTGVGGITPVREWTKRNPKCPQHGVNA